MTVPTGTTVKPVEMLMTPRENVPGLHITDTGVRAPEPPCVCRHSARNSQCSSYSSSLFLMVTGEIRYFMLKCLKTVQWLSIQFLFITEKESMGCRSRPLVSLSLYFCNAFLVLCKIVMSWIVVIPQKRVKNCFPLTINTYRKKSSQEKQTKKNQKNRT